MKYKSYPTLLTACLIVILAITMPSSSVFSFPNTVEGVNPDSTSAINAKNLYEIGDDTRISYMGPEPDADFQANRPAVAYNSTAQEYLVVWSGEDAIDDKYEIWAQRINALTGARIGDNYRLSYTGPDTSNPDYDADQPDIAYNSRQDEYLVVWSSDHVFDDKFEIRGLRLKGIDGQAIDSPFAISTATVTTNDKFDAYAPAVAFNVLDNSYIVVWSADSSSSGMVDEEFEIWGTRILSDGSVSLFTKRISEMGGTGDAAYDAFMPDIVFNSQMEMYLVVWYGDDNTNLLVNNKYVIWGQRLEWDATLTGDNFRISENGARSDGSRDAFYPAAAYNPNLNQYLVVYSADYVDDDIFNIIARTYNSNGELSSFIPTFIGASPNPINPYFDRFRPAVSYDLQNKSYLVVWEDDSIEVDEFEIWGIVLDNEGQTIPYIWKTRLSEMNVDGVWAHDATDAAIAYSDLTVNNFLVVWSGDDVTDEDKEIWGQLVTGGVKAYIPVVLR